MCHEKTVLTIVKKLLFLTLSFRLTYLRRWASALPERENLHLTFHLGWFGNFQDRLPLFLYAVCHHHPQLHFFLVLDLFLSCHH